MSTRRERLAAETQSDIETAEQRLRQLGASPEEIADFLAGWDTFEEGVWTPEIRQEWLHAPDHEVIADMLGARLEEQLGATVDETAELLDEARGVLEGNRESVFEWVGEDPARAAAALALEGSAAGANRSSVLERLRKVAGPTEP